MDFSGAESSTCLVRRTNDDADLGCGCNLCFLILVFAVLFLMVLSAENLYNYLTSFAPDSAPQALPLLSKWMEQFQQKLKSRGVSLFTE